MNSILSPKSAADNSIKMSEKTQIFKDVTFYIVGDISEDVINLLSSEGGKRDTYLSEMVSHVIADSTEPDEYSEAKEIFERPIVSSNWVRLSVICKKQLPKERFALEGCLFSGVVACPSRLDVTDAKSVWSMLVYNGGRCQLNFDKNVTHLICSSTDGVKYAKGLNKEKVHTVTPDWVTDCVKKESKQEETIYHPRLIVYPKPETPPPKPKPMFSKQHTDLSDLSAMIGQQMALGNLTAPSPFARRRKSSSDDSPRNGSRPGTPSAKEALARMVSSRLQASGKNDPNEISATLASMFPHGQYPGPPPGLPLSPGQATMPFGQAPLQGMSYGMSMGQGQSPTRGHSPVQGHPLAHMPHAGQGHQQNQMYMQGQLPHMNQNLQQPHQSPTHLQTSPNPHHMQTSPNQSPHLSPGKHPSQMMMMKSLAQPQMSPKHPGQMSQSPMPPQGQMPHYPGQVPGQVPLHHQGPPQPIMSQGQVRHPGQGQVPPMSPSHMHNQLPAPTGQMRPQMSPGKFQGKPGQHPRQPGPRHRQPHPQMQIPGQGHPQFPGHPGHQGPNASPGKVSMPSQMPAQYQNQMQHQLQAQLQNQLHMSNQLQGQMPHSHPGQMPSVQGQAAVHHQGQMPTQLTTHPPQSQMPHQMQSQMAGKMHNQIPHQLQSQMSPQMPGQIPNQMQGQMPNVGQGQMSGQIPGMSLSGVSNSGMMQQLQKEAFQQNRTLRNITNNAPGAEMIRSPNKQAASKISQMLEMNRPPPPMYPGRGIPPGGLQRPPAPTLPVYYGHDPSENIAPDMCLIGCVFYIHDYQSLLGENEIKTWKEVISQHGGEVEDTYTSRVTHVLCSNQKSEIFHKALNDQIRVVTAFWLNDCLIQKKMCPPSQALHLPVPFGEQKPCHNQIICVTNFDGEERKRVKQLITSLGAKYTGYLTHTNSVLICKKPDGVKYKKAKEWKIPVVNVQWLTDLLCGYLDALRLPLNQKYKIPNLVNPFILNTELVSRLLVGWRLPLKVPKEAWVKFISKPKPSPDQENINGVKRPLEDSNIEEVLSKKPRLESVTSSNTSAVLFTGFSSVITKQLHKIADHLGLSVVQNAKDCSHVIIPSLSRTIKLFEAISVCKYILTRQWLDDSLDQAKLLDEEKYMLKDTKNEKEFSCCIIDSLHRAQIKPLFQGMTFYITPSVVPSTKDLTRIISNAGGTVVNRRPSAKTILTQLDDKGKPTFIVITCNNDLHLCRDLFAQKINVYNAEFVLTGVLRQEIDYTMFTITIPT